MVSESWTGVAVHPDCVAAVEHAGRACAVLGHQVGPLRLAVDAASLFEQCSTILLSGVAGMVRQREQALGRPGRPDELENVTWACIRAFECTTAIQMHAANAAINRIVRQTARFFRDFDVVLTPMLSVPPAKLGVLRMDGDDATAYLRQMSDYGAFTPLFSASGQPAMNLPLFRNAEGLPIGVQAVARFADDATLLRLAAQLEPGFIGMPS